MNNAKSILDFLDYHDITYTLKKHQPVHSVSDIDLYNARTNGEQTKTLLMWNKKTLQLVMIIAPAKEKLDMKKLSNKVQIKHLSFIPPDDIIALFDGIVGSISPFTLQSRVPTNLTVIIYQDLLNKNLLAFHPNTNTATIDIHTSDLLVYFALIACPYSIY